MKTVSNGNSFHGPNICFRYGLRIMCLSTLIFSVWGCGQKDWKGLDDPEWKQSSSMQIRKVCEKLSDCQTQLRSKASAEELDAMPKMMSLDQCEKNYHKSRIYHLSTEYDPKVMKQNFRKCYESVLKLSCDQIHSGSLNSIEACMIVARIQRGEKLN